MNEEIEQLRFYNPDRRESRIVNIQGDNFVWWAEPKGERGDGRFIFPQGSRTSLADWITSTFRVDGFEPVKNPELK